jgi:hypothetical protein
LQLDEHETNLMLGLAPSLNKVSTLSGKLFLMH